MAIIIQLTILTVRVILPVMLSQILLVCNAFLLLGGGSRPDLLVIECRGVATLQA